MRVFTHLSSCVALTLAVNVVGVDARTASSQPPPLIADHPRDQPAASGTAGIDALGQESNSTLTAAEQKQVEKWIEQLGSKEFAKRERAAGHLMELGTVVLPQLRHIAKESSDVETRLRAEQIVQRLADGDVRERISAFLSGGSAGFAGWTPVQDAMGDSPWVRELFVEMLQAHPDFVASLSGTPRERTIALEGVLTRIQNKFRPVGEDHTRADVFALLLVGSDRSIPLNALYEDMLLGLTRRPVISNIRRDARLAGSFHGMLNAWMGRSSLANRDDVLMLAMAWDMPVTLPLALMTLGETTQTETIVTCMQAIAKFGDRRHADVLVRFLDDTRPASSRGFGEEQERTQIRDLAMLTLAMLHDLPLAEIGMAHVQTHPASGFIPSDIAYPSDPQRSREKARQRIDQLLTELPTPAKS